MTVTILIIYKYPTKHKDKNLKKKNILNHHVKSDNEK